MATIDQAVLGATVNVGTTVSVSVTSNATGNRAALVTAIQRSPGGSGSLLAASCTYGGVAMTLVSSTFDVTSGINVYCFKLANPLTGTQTVTFTCAANSGSMNLAVVTATGCDQTTIASGYAASAGNSTTSSVTPTGNVAGNIAVALFGSTTAGAGYTAGSVDANSTSIAVDNSGAQADAGASRRTNGSAAAMTYAVTTGTWVGVTAFLLDATAAPVGGAPALRIPNRYVGPMALRNLFRRPTPWTAATAGGPQPVAGTITGTGAVTASLRVARAVAAGITGTGTVTAQLAVKRAIQATITGAGTVTAQLAVKRPLQATIAGASTVSGSLAVKRALQASIGGTGTVSASLAVSRRLGTASFTGTGAVSAQLAVKRTLAGVIGGVGVVHADLTVPGSAVGAAQERMTMRLGI